MKLFISIFLISVLGVSFQASADGFGDALKRGIKRGVKKHGKKVAKRAVRKLTSESYTATYKGKGYTFLSSCYDDACDLAADKAFEKCVKDMKSEDACEPQECTEEDFKQKRDGTYRCKASYTYIGSYIN